MINGKFYPLNRRIQPSEYHHEQYWLLRSKCGFLLSILETDQGAVYRLFTSQKTRPSCVIFSRFRVTIMSKEGPKVPTGIRNTIRRNNKV